MSRAPFDDVVTEQLGKVYTRQRALADVSFAMAPGEAVAVLGPNGAGKSTLLGMLGTLIRPSSGALWFSGEPPSAAHRAGIGVLAHESLCYGELSGRENLAFFARLYGVSRAASQIDALLARLGLAHAAHRPARTYSRGMLQRLALGRTLVHGPRLILLDEPFTGLDREGIATLRALLCDERERGAIVFVISHDLPSLLGLATRVLVLRRGRLVHDGSVPATDEGLRALYETEAHTAGSDAGRASPTATGESSGALR